MTNYPFSFDQAEALCKDFQNLIGKKFSTDSADDAIVECVAISPYDGVNKHMFLEEYTSCNNATLALKVYDCELFDVIVIADKKGENGHFRYKDLLNYLDERQIEVDINNYIHQAQSSSAA
jgi:hypothetical protein